MKAALWLSGRLATTLTLLVALILSVTMVSPAHASDDPPADPVVDNTAVCSNPSAPIEGTAPVACDDVPPMRTYNSYKYKLDLVANDVDPSGLPLKVKACSRPPKPANVPSDWPDAAKITVNSDGTITLDMVGRYSGTFTVQCVVTNGSEDSNLSKFTVTIAKPIEIKIKRLNKHFVRLDNSKSELKANIGWRGINTGWRKKIQVQPGQVLKFRTKEKKVQYNITYQGGQGPLRGRAGFV